MLGQTQRESSMGGLESLPRNHLSRTVTPGFLHRPPLCFVSATESLQESQAEKRMGHSNIWNAHPKNYGPGSRACRVCGNPHAIIRKYGIMCCRQCFRNNAKEIGFIKYR
ncbi:unnamed protein product [Cuscuta campestris]|uniref:40S ribosomal protein S29 n=1 Tax=Cuscuta campestris TaxID=132261 RepID=A0A484ME98_9ASTE|nr:unnamed protein product [Cuscuta campestris]